jgi:hypothetical protein
MLLTTTIVAGALGGCAGHGHRSAEERTQQYPDNYKTELLEFLHTYINDPTKIRDAQISDPMLTTVNASSEGGGGSGGGGRRGGRRDGGNGGAGEDGSEGGGLLGLGGSNPFGGGSVKRERYVVCVHYNAKDRDGRYTGVKQGMAIYFHGRFDGFNEQPHGPCDQAEFKPFPELEKLSR